MLHSFAELFYPILLSHKALTDENKLYVVIETTEVIGILKNFANNTGLGFRLEGP